MPVSQKLDIPHDELNLDYTLTSGQAFRWKKMSDGWWRGVVSANILQIRQAEIGFEWETFPDSGNLGLLRDYFRLDDDIAAVYSQLAATDPHVAYLIERFRGLRMLRQDPVETLLSFICSAANSIPRISKGIEEMSRLYGEYIGEVDGVRYHAFPTLEALAAADDSQIWTATRLGFRCPSLKNVALQLLERPEGWLYSLRDAPYEDAKAELLDIQGVGQKIADCVCLFALDKNEAVPVDTHVRQLAVRLYMPEITTRSITTSVYNRIGDFFRSKFDGYAGWAQQFLYYEDVLRSRGEL
ncbi:MAG: DNA glycosylase [Armatimonadota bacterium]|nr:DNA glycosylase [Armatimonadota bacterium]